MELICWIFPAFIARKIQNKRTKRDGKINDYTNDVLAWGCWVLVINCLTLVVLLYVLNMEGVLVDAFSSLSFSLKYMFISMIIATILPYILEIVLKYFEIKIEIEKTDDRYDNVQNKK